MSGQEENRDYEHKQSVRDYAPIYSLNVQEKDKPQAGHEPLSGWLIVVCVLLLFVGGTYVGANSGGFKFGSNSIRGYEPSAPDGLLGKVPELSDLEKYVKGGEQVYKAVCNGCHQFNGGGQGQIPPLVDSEWILHGTERFSQIVLNGLRGPVTVKGASYGGQEMPAQKGALKDKQIAQVMTYVRSKFGNITDSVVTKEMVTDSRARFAARPNQYTAGELSSQDLDLPGEQPEWVSPEAEGTESTETPPEEKNTSANPPAE